MPVPRAAGLWCRGHGVTIRHMLARILCLSWIVVAGAAQSTLIVQNGAPGAFPTLAAAVAAASDGDVILVRTGIESVSGLRIDKSLRIIGEGSTFFSPITVLQDGPLVIALPAGKELVLARLAPYSLNAMAPAAIEIDGCQGRVSLQDCGSGFASVAPTGSAYPTIDIRDSSQVLLSGCDHIGFLLVERSTVVADRCRFRGANAQVEFSAPSVNAAQFVDADVRCVDTVIQGGNGQHTLSGTLPGSHAMNALRCNLVMAGPGMAVASGSLTTWSAIYLTDTTLTLEPGAIFTVNATNSTIVQQPLPSVGVAGMLLGQTGTLTLRSPTGTLGAIFVGLPGDRMPVPGVGDLWLDPQHLCSAVLGVQNGSLAWSIALPPAPALFATPFRWQGAMLANGTVALSAPGAVLLR